MVRAGTSGCWRGAVDFPNPGSVHSGDKRIDRGMIKVKTLVLGGDGFCGWPSTLHLSARGHDVVIVDNLSRRKIDVELEVESLTPIAPLGARLKAWNAVSGKAVAFHRFDIAENYHRLLTL